MVNPKIRAIYDNYKELVESIKHNYGYRPFFLQPDIKPGLLIVGKPEIRYTPQHICWYDCRSLAYLIGEDLKEHGFPVRYKLVEKKGLTHVAAITYDKRSLRWWLVDPTPFNGNGLVPIWKKGQIFDKLSKENVLDLSFSPVDRTMLSLEQDEELFRVVNMGVLGPMLYGSKIVGGLYNLSFSANEGLIGAGQSNAGVLLDIKVNNTEIIERRRAGMESGDWKEAPVKHLEGLIEEEALSLTIETNDELTERLDKFWENPESVRRQPLIDGFRRLSEIADISEPYSRTVNLLRRNLDVVANVVMNLPTVIGDVGGKALNVMTGEVTIVNPDGNYDSIISSDVLIIDSKKQRFYS